MRDATPRKPHPHNSRSTINLTHLDLRHKGDAVRASFVTGGGSYRCTRHTLAQVLKRVVKFPQTLEHNAIDRFTSVRRGSQTVHTAKG